MPTGSGKRKNTVWDPIKEGIQQPRKRGQTDINVMCKGRKFGLGWGKNPANRKIEERSKRPIYKKKKTNNLRGRKDRRNC